MEFYCSSANSDKEYLTMNNHKCSNGCEDGACVKSNQTDEKSSYILKLKDGWNLISPKTKSLSKKEISDNCEITSMWGWKEGKYKKVEETLKGGKGYWVHPSKTCKFKYKGQPYESTPKLREKWNLIGISEDTGKEDITRQCGSVGSIYEFSEQSDGGGPGSPSSGQGTYDEIKFSDMEFGTGYWLYCNESQDMFCNDTDGGKDYYEKGKTTGLDNYKGSKDEVSTYKDKCDGDRVMEFYCSSANSDKEYLTMTNHKCSNDCEDGACVESSLNITSSSFDISGSAAILSVETVGGKDQAKCYYKLSERRGYSKSRKGEYIRFEKYSSNKHSQKFYVKKISTLNNISIMCKDGEGGVAKKETSPQIKEEEDIGKTCDDLMNFLRNPSDIVVDGEKWELRYNHTRQSQYTDRKSYYASFGKTDGSGSSYIRIDISELSEKEDIKKQLNRSLRRGLCEQEKIELENENKQIVHICNNFWRMESGSISNKDNKEKVILWINENKLFSIEVSSRNYERCGSYKSCMKREVEEYKRKQEKLINTMEKVINNEAEYQTDFYLNWETENFVKYIISRCGSDLKETEEYVGSWKCKTKPTICPPHGRQTKVCTRYNSKLGKEEVREREIRCSPGVCSGCYVPRWFGGRELNERCIPYGFRFEKKTEEFKIEEVYEERTDKEGLTVRRAKSFGEEVDLKVYENDTALLTLKEDVKESKKIYLEKGKTYDWDFGHNTEINQTLTANDIYYNSSDYESSYIKVTFKASGTRKVKKRKTIPMYCDIDGEIKRQKTREMVGGIPSCQNDYECKSNTCSSGECIEVAQMVSEASAFKSLGAKIACRLAGVLGVRDYNKCLTEFLGKKKAAEAEETNSGGGSSGGGGNSGQVTQ